jgi:type II secretory pathway component GspD/PulD (secretin)
MNPLRVLGFLSAAIVASAAFGQTERVLHVTQNQTSDQMGQIATTLRATTDIERVLANADQGTVSVIGTPVQLDMAVWLVKELDQSVQPSGPQVYRPPASTDDSLRVFFLAHPRTPQQLNEFVTNVRNIVDVRRLFTYPALNAIVLRGTDSQVAMTAWLVNQLDQPVGTASPAPNQYKLTADDLGRVFNLTNPQTPQQIQEMVTLIRSVADVQRIFVYNARKSVAMRGTSEQIALAEWLVKLLDRPAPAAGTNEYRLTKGPDNLVRVFYLPSSRTQQERLDVAVQVRSTTHMGRLFVYSPLGALAVRGTVGQVATAEKVIEEMGVAPRVQ